MKTKLILFSILINWIFLSCKTNPSYSEEEQKYIDIAEQAIIDLYGQETLESRKPLIINRKDSVWVVHGSLPEGMDGGVPWVIIDSESLEILDIYHTK